MALTVEDGTGLATADAYWSLADTTTCLTDYYTGISTFTTWNALSDEAKERSIRWGTFYLDTLYGPSFMGNRVLETQALQFPRYGLESPDGYALDSDEVPLDIKQAMAIAAMNQGAGDVLLPDLTAEDGSPLEKKSISLGPIKLFKDYGGARSEVIKKYTMIEKLVDPYLVGGGLGGYVSRG